MFFRVLKQFLKQKWEETLGTLDCDVVKTIAIALLIFVGALLVCWGVGFLFCQIPYVWGLFHGNGTPHFLSYICAGVVFFTVLMILSVVIIMIYKFFIWLADNWKTARNKVVYEMMEEKRKRGKR